MSKKYYWLKLRKDFLKRHDIKFLESLSDGQLYVLFYLKLMLESVDHDGELRFNDDIPYTPEMLSAITDTDIEVVKSALGYLTQLGMVEYAQDGTIVIDKVKEMIGCAADNDNAIRQKRYRDKKKAENADKITENNGTLLLDVTDSNGSALRIITKDRDRDRDRDIKEKSIKEKSQSHFIPPTVEEVSEYCLERGNGINAESFVSFYESKGWYVGKNKMKDWKAAVRTWENHDKNKAITKPNPSGNPFDSFI